MDKEVEARSPIRVMITEFMVEEHGYLVDYEHLYIGKLNALPHHRKIGWKVYNKDGGFEGLLDRNKSALWYIEEDSCELWRENY